MKKNASFIMMDSALAQSLYQALETLPVQSAYAEELRLISSATDVWCSTTEKRSA